jgi:hypothetical protein
VASVLSLRKVLLGSEALQVLELPEPNPIAGVDFTSWIQLELRCKPGVLEE